MIGKKKRIICPPVSMKKDTILLVSDSVVLGLIKVKVMGTVVCHLVAVVNGDKSTYFRSLVFKI